MLKARKAVRDLPVYHPPLKDREGLRLDFNENTGGCSPRVLACLRNLTAEQIARYPEREPIEAVAATHLGVRPQEILLTNGVDEAIHLLCEAFLEPEDEVLIAEPTFPIYEIAAAATGAHVIRIPMAEDFRFPTADLLSRITERTRLIAIANPNNPTGCVVPRDQLLEITRRASDAAVLIDEAYFEFFGETLLPQWRKLSNLFIARTFSKAYGLAGLRIGLLAGKAENINPVRKVSLPFNINGVAPACLPEALADRAYVEDYVEQVRRGRERLQRELHDRGIPCFPSQANFVLARLGSLNSAFILRMRERGILLRDRSTDFACAGCVRMTLGTLVHTEQLLIALRQTLEEIGYSTQSVKFFQDIPLIPGKTPPKIKVARSPGADDSENQGG